jgi:peptidyl-tRNA hydrolase, PTH1 family
VDPILLTGLGNPGDEYADTRHNIGFRIIDIIGGRLAGRRVRATGECTLTLAKVEGTTVLLCKPVTYMNNSGLAVAEVLSRYGIPMENLLVMVDDFALPLGKLRLRRSGSDGGHNGLYSIIMELGTEIFPRLRCGIGREVMPPKEKIAEFVLSPFDRNERPEAAAMAERASEAALEFVRSGLASAMNKFNT